MLDLDPNRPTTSPRDAATVLLLRELPLGTEVFLVRRHGKSGFLGGATVFPGGTLDRQDRDRGWRSLARGDGIDDPERIGGKADPLAHRVAAVRETFEEAGVWLGDPRPDPDTRRALRRRLLAGTSFRSLVAEVGATLPLDRLHPHARWITPRQERRRYDTVFFATEVPVSDDPAAGPDLRETTEGGWTPPARALEDARAGRIVLAPPTVRTLELLAAAGSTGAFLATCGDAPLPCIEPVFTERGGVPTLHLPGDPEHPVPAPALPGSVRLVLENGRWEPADASQLPCPAEPD